MTLTPGTRLGPYAIESLLGAGGMGEVYRATDTRLDRPVAIKTLPARLSSNSSLRERFEREARTISSLTHPNICTLYDIGQEDDVSFLVMELLEGESLAERLARGPLALRDALEIAAQIARALERAHRAGITHRDLKPGNVMLTRGSAKLLDFGLAKMAATMTDAEAPTEHLKPLTAEGTIVGTFQYMAPEQIEGREADARTDIFAFGAVLYEMITGVPAFEGATKTSLMASILARDPRPISELQPLAPPQLQRIVDRCLRKDPEQRWQSAGDLAHELSWIAQSGSGEARAPVSAVTRNWRRVALLAAIVAAALLIGAAAARLWPRESPATLMRATISPPKGVDFGVITETGMDTVAVSPDGSLVVIVGVEETGKRRLWIRRLDELEAKPLAGTEGGRYPFWSPDSRSIAFFSGGKLKTVSTDGTPPVAICEVGSNPLGGAWNRDDVILFSPASGLPLHSVDARGGKPVPVTTLDESAGESTHRWPRFLPDGKSFLYLAAAHELPRTSEVNAVYAGRLGSPERKLVFRNRSNFEILGDHLLFVRDATIYAVRFDQSELRLIGDAEPIAEGVHHDTDSFVAIFSASARGPLVYLSSSAERPAEIVTLDLQGNALARSVAPSSSFRWWDASPDGRMLALTVTDPTEGSDIWLYPVEEGPPRRLTTGHSASEPVWAPDSARIAYVGSDPAAGTQPQSRSNSILVRETRAGAEPKPLLRLTTWGAPTAWSPDGRYIAYWQFDPKTTTGFDAGFFPVGESGEPLLFARSTGSEFPLGFSPDSRWLLFSSNESGREELYAVMVEDPRRRQQLSVGGASGGEWVGSEIWYLGPDRTFVTAGVAERDGELRLTSPRTLFRDERITAFRVVAPNRLLVSRLVGEATKPRLELVSDWRALLRRKR